MIIGFTIPCEYGFFYSYSIPIISVAMKLFLFRINLKFLISSLNVTNVLFLL